MSGLKTSETNFTIEDIHIRSSFKIPCVFTIFHNFSGRAKFFIGLKLKFVSNRDTWCFHDFFVLTFDFVFDSTPAQGARNILARNFKMSQLEFYGKRKGFNFERKKNHKKSSNGKRDNRHWGRLICWNGCPVSYK